MMLLSYMLKTRVSDANAVSMAGSREDDVSEPNEFLSFLYIFSHSIFHICTTNFLIYYRIVS